jgi:YHS domain-containing protein
MSERVKDPVCGMEVEKDAAQGPVEHMGKTFYFCSAECKQKFENQPMKYMGK